MNFIDQEESVRNAVTNGLLNNCLSISLIDSRRIVLSNRFCKVRFSAERYDYGFTCEVEDVGTGRKMPLMYLCAFQDRTERTYGFIASPDASLSERFAADFGEHIRLLELHASEIISGETQEFLKSGYLEFETRIANGSSIVWSLPSTHPIYRKYYDGDFSWIEDVTALKQEVGAGPIVAESTRKLSIKEFFARFLIRARRMWDL